MPSTQAVQFTFVGDINASTFVGFARHRAARLDLGLIINSTAASRISISVRGQAALIDAFEMACSLGPADCLIHDVIRSG